MRTMISVTIALAVTVLVSALAARDASIRLEDEEKARKAYRAKQEDAKRKARDPRWQKLFMEAEIVFGHPLAANPETIGKTQPVQPGEVYGK